MKKFLDCDTEAFLELVKAGLWPHSYDVARFLGNKRINGWDNVLCLAQEQSVVGLVVDGIERLAISVPQEIKFTLVGMTLQIEQTNKAMNDFVAKLMQNLSQEGIIAVLVKGQGVAQCYERPERRASGDVDLFLDEKNYQKAKTYLSPLASNVEEEDKRIKHLGMTIDGWIVELHGTMHTYISARINGVLDKIQCDIFERNVVRTWENGGLDICLPSATHDAFMVFTHLLNHFYIEGVGLRQVCDWSRLLWHYRDDIEWPVLKNHILLAGLTLEWDTFLYMANKYLAMPTVDMTFSSRCYDYKAEKILSRIIETGNMGHNKDLSYRERYHGITYKLVSLLRRMSDFAQLSLIFPKNTLKFSMFYMRCKVDLR